MRIYYYGKLIADNEQNKEIEKDNNDTSMTDVSGVLKGQFSQTTTRAEEEQNYKTNLKIRHYNA